MKDAFLLAACPTCDEEVLLAYALVADELVTCCLHCDRVIDSGSAREASVEEVVAAGYPVEGAPKPAGDRGCRDGKCGVRQPER